MLKESLFALSERITEQYIANQLLEYCKLDTLAMAKIADFFGE